MEKRSLKNSLLRQKKSIVSMLIVSLLAVSIFQLYRTSHTIHFEIFQPVLLFQIAL